jgi:hypothetical protein
MVSMSSIESSIDSLYQTPPAEFVAARNALAKTLKGDEARRIKELQKPAAAAWAVNQVYWQTRAVYDRLIQSGKKLRSVQIGALKGRSVDVRPAADEHRMAVAQAVAEASRLALDAGVHPNTDDVSRTFESLSLGTTQPEAPGRLTKALQPAGFEALAGLAVKAPARASIHAESQAPKTHKAAASQRITEDARIRQRKEAEAEREKRAAIKEADAALARAQAAEHRARTEWERRRDDREAAEQTLARLRES